MKKAITAGVNGINNGFKIVDWYFNQLNNIRDRVIQWAVKKYCPPQVTPNAISILRAIGGLVIACLMFYSVDQRIVQILFLIIVFSDALDGSVARAFNLETEFGGFLDRLADKILVCPVVIMTLDDNILIFLICGGELISSALALSALIKKVSVKSNIWGKWKMLFQCLGCLALIFNRILLGDKILWIALGLGFASLVGHVQDLRKK